MCLLRELQRPLVRALSPVVASIYKPRGAVKIRHAFVLLWQRLTYDLTPILRGLQTNL
jgi:hypothetical protein